MKIGSLQGIMIPDEYVALPKNASLFDLKEQIENYYRPEYETVEYVRTDIVSTSYFKLRKNVGRFRGNDAKVYETVSKSLEKGYKQGKLPPIVLEKINRQELENWLVNGNHRWMWYCNNGYAWMIVDVYRTKEGFDEGDVLDEVGLLYQPQPDGSSSVFDDYKARGISWVHRQKSKGLIVTQEDVNTWVDKFSRNETSQTRTNLKKFIFNNTEKSSFLTNYTRSQVIRFFKNCNFVILDKNDQVVTNVVDRLYEASQDVWIRDFLPTFLRDTAKNLTTRLNFYVNTSNAKDGLAVTKMIENRLAQLDEILDNLDKINGTGSILRKSLIYGYRPPHIVDTDPADTLVSIKGNVNVKVDTDTENKNLSQKKLEMTLSILQSNFGNRQFTSSEAYDAVRLQRTNVSDFKNEESFRGTILNEIQTLQTQKYVTWHKRGLYSIT